MQIIRTFGGEENLRVPFKVTIHNQLKALITITGERGDFGQQIFSFSPLAGAPKSADQQLYIVLLLNKLKG